MDTPLTLKLLCDVFDAMEDARTSQDLRVEMEKFTRKMGFENFAYALSVSAPSLVPEQIIISGFSGQWLNRYVEHGYFKVDPLIRHAQRSTLPAIWTDKVFHDDESHEFWEEAQAFGLLAGMSFAVREQTGVTGIFSLARDQHLDLQAQELAALIGRAQLFASVLHQAVLRLELPKFLKESHSSLTGRERECLKWSADGKTAWEIGQILGIAERTAVFHINNIIQKLGAANKTQAIVRAVALNLV